MEVYLSLNPLAGVGRGWQELQMLGCIMVSVDFLLLIQEIRYFPAGVCTGRELIFILPVPSRAPDCHSLAVDTAELAAVVLAEHLPVLFIEESAPHFWESCAAIAFLLPKKALQALPCAAN